MKAQVILSVFVVVVLVYVSDAAGFLEGREAAPIGTYVPTDS